VPNLPQCLRKACVIALGPLYHLPFSGAVLGLTSFLRLCYQGKGNLVDCINAVNIDAGKKTIPTVGGGEEPLEMLEYLSLFIYRLLDAITS